VKASHVLLLVLLLLSQASLATEYSVVLGHGVSNVFLSLGACDPGELCMDARYLWTLRAERTIAGPSVRGVVRAVTSQHTDATAQFVKSVELLVLVRVSDAAARSADGAEYSLVTLSPRYPGNRYCLAIDPLELGIRMPRGHVTRDPQSSYYCFPRADVRR